MFLAFLKDIHTGDFLNSEGWTTSFGCVIERGHKVTFFCPLKTALVICADLGHFVPSSPGTYHCGPFSAMHKHSLLN